MAAQRLEDEKCPCCGNNKFEEIVCDTSASDDIFHIGYVCKACGLWFDSLLCKWLVDYDGDSDLETAIVFEEQ